VNIMNKVTSRSLKKNKARTIVTIIGIILSAAMITAVTTLIASMQNYMVNLSIAEEGNWHAAFHNIHYEHYEKIKDLDEVEKAVPLREIGYSLLEGCTNEHKPYLYLLELDKEAFDMLPIHLLRGRLPQNENEVVISEHIHTNGGVAYQLGDTLKLDIGQRISEDSMILGQKDSFVKAEDGVSERLEVNETRSYTVVGIMKRLSYRLEGYTAPGYTIITLNHFSGMADGGQSDNDNLSVYFRVKNPLKIHRITNEIAEAEQISLEQLEENSDVLRYMGISRHDNFKAVLYSLGAILIVLIMVGSISLIYNSFCISVSERTKQFGLLSSVGATSKQIRHSVIFEAFALALIGIPLGVLAGLVGIRVTLYFMEDLFASLISADVAVAFTMTVSVPSIVVAAITAMVTILISAHIPARRSAKISAIEAIGQAPDIQLKAKQVKTSWMTRKLFGLEGDLALKNMKRNKKRYRNTVVSLFISVVLFISASAFSMYLRDSVVNVYEDYKHDISYHFMQNKPKESINQLYEDIMALSTIENGSIVTTVYTNVYLPKEKLDETFYNERLDAYTDLEDGEDLPVHVEIHGVDHDTFMKYIQELGLEEARFNDPTRPAGIMIDKQHYYDYEAKKYINSSILKDRSVESVAIEFYIDQKPVQTEVTVAGFADTAPFGISDYAWNGVMMLIMDYDSMPNVIPEHPLKHAIITMYFASKEPFKAEEDIRDVLNNAGYSASNLTNTAQIIQSSRNIITIISVFSYGFIVLISLITIANVFNTISTNVNLRRREFAMLKSVGMTDRSFNRMLNFECIFYGLKALLYGLPVSLFISYLIYRSVDQGVEMGFYLPVKGILISVFSVFFVVFVSMMYSMSKIRNENILDALKNENL
jgi:putative ABC transport system permease protein